MGNLISHIFQALEITEVSKVRNTSIILNVTYCLLPFAEYVHNECDINLDENIFDS